MKLRSRCWLGLLALVHQAAAWEHATEPELRTALESSGYTLVAFVLPNETASKELEPEWTSIQENPEYDYVVSFDCGSNLATCKELDALAYPAIRLYYRDGRIDRYRGPRKSDAIISFVRRSFRPSPYEVTEFSVTSFMTIDDIVFIGHPHPDEYLLYQRYRALAKKYRDRYSFGVASSGGHPSVIRCFNNVDDEQHEMTELDQVGALEEFVHYCATPLIPEMTRRNEAEILMTGRSIMHFLTDSEEEKDKFRKDIRSLAKKYKEYVQFAITDLNEYPEMPASFGLSPRAKSGLAMQNPSNGDMFPYKGGKKLTAEVVEKFLNDIVDGKVKPLTGGDQRLKAKHDEL